MPVAWKKLKYIPMYLNSYDVDVFVVGEIQFNNKSKARLSRYKRFGKEFKQKKMLKIIFLALK